MQKRWAVLGKKLGPSRAPVLRSVWERSEVILKAALQPEVNEVYEVAPPCPANQLLLKLRGGNGLIVGD